MVFYSGDTPSGLNRLGLSFLFQLLLPALVLNRGDSSFLVHVW